MNTKTLFGVFALTTALAVNSPAQVYQFSEPLGGRLTMSAQDDVGDGSGAFQLNFNSLSETIYVDTVNNTIRQVGTIQYTPSTTNSIQFTESQRGIPGTVTVNLAPTNGYLYFDTGVSPVIWNPTTETFTYGPYGAADVPFFITIDGSYSLVTGGQTLSGSFAYTTSDNQDGDFTAAYTYWQISLTDYPSSLQLSGLGDCCDNNGGSCFQSPGVVADVTASNGFHLQLQPGINPYWAGEGPGELFTWSAPSVAANFVSGEEMPCPATATATVADGIVVAAPVTDGGCGFTNTPLVVIQGGGGSGAAAIALVSNDVVVGIEITDAGSNYSSAPTILIGEPPVILTQPQSITTEAHQTALFNITATEGSNTYQWSFNGTNIYETTNADGLSTLAISNATQANLGTYSVLVTDPFGATISSNAVLSMYPYIATPFTGLVTYWGQSPTLNMQAWGTGPLSFQWLQNGFALPNATNQTLCLPNIQFTNAGLYSVVVSSALGSVTNPPAQVVVEPAGVSLGLFPGVFINGTIGYNYIIQSTTNLANTNAWVTVTNLTLTQPVQLWVDTNTDTALPGNPQKFYQVLPGQ